MVKVVTFGEILLRLSPNGFYRFFQNDQMQASFGGGEANVAVSLANYGIETSFVTKVPDNPIGKGAIKALDCFGVNTKSIVIGGERLGIYFLEKGASQRPSMVVYDRKRSSIAMADKNDFDWASVFGGSQWFHFSGITPALSDSLFVICFDACKKAKELGLTVSCDLNYRKNLWTSDKAQSVMKELMPYVDICIANEEDAEKTLGIVPENSNYENGKIDRSGYIDVARKICKTFHCSHVAITLRKSYSASKNGWSGMLFDSRNQECAFSKEYDIQIVDRVGSGDSFAAGIIFGLLNGNTNQKTVDFATAASCLKHSIEGDFNRITVNEVEQLIKSGGSGRVQR